MVKISKLLNISTKLILASKSPRRIKLLSDLGFEFKVMPSHIDETITDELLPSKYVMKLSLEKAKFVANSIDYAAWVIGADTTVVLDGKYLNKPTDKNDAFRILSELSGRTHKVFTGIAIVESLTGRNVTAYQETDVTFRKLLDDEIWAYIESGSPMDKAGAYGIQDDFGAVFVSNIVGCYYNIVGLPVELLYRKLREFAE